ncbi:MAG TPA: OmpA family protein [Clostridia bacterium]|nr:OmpA family protein [Clostridia bacterium]
MKNRFLLALPLAATLMVPAIAQTSSSSQSTEPQQPAATSTQTGASSQSTGMQQSDTSQVRSDQAQADANLAAHQPLQQDTRQGFWGKLNPFARKKYVSRQLSPIRNRVNELDELTSKNSQMVRDVDSRAQEGIRMASAKANEADQHAIEAGNRAQTAHQTAEQANTRLTTVANVVGNIDQYQPATQTEIRFRSGQTLLSQKAKAALDEMAASLKDQKGYVVEVQGFSPGRGSAAIQTSQNMADAVVRYLVLEHQIPVYRIFVLGMGNAPVKDAEGKATRVRAGRVEVTLLKNNLDQLASATGTSSDMGMQTSTGSAAQGTATQTQGGVTGSTTQPSSTQGQSTGTVAAPTQQEPPKMDNNPR